MTPKFNYIVCADDDILGLQKQVESCFLDGFECQGGISVTVNKAPLSQNPDIEVCEFWYYQAMIKKESE